MSALPESVAPASLPFHTETTSELHMPDSDNLVCCCRGSSPPPPHHFLLLLRCKHGNPINNIYVNMERCHLCVRSSCVRHCMMVFDQLTVACVWQYYRRRRSRRVVHSISKRQKQLTVAALSHACLRMSTWLPCSGIDHRTSIYRARGG